jgi:PAN domain
MPRMTIQLPKTRAECSFGQLVYWHLFDYGTRPDGDPSAEAGRRWGLKDVCAPQHLNVSERTLRYWIRDKHLPDSTDALERVLFGNSKSFDRERMELVVALRRARLRNAAKAAPTPASAKSSAAQLTSGAVVPVDRGMSVPDETEPQEDEAEEFEIVAIPHHKFEDGPDRNGRSEIVEPAPEIFYASRKPRPAQTPRRARNAAIAVVGVTTLLGLYVWASNRPKDTYVVTELSKKDDKPLVPVTPTPASKDPPQVPALNPVEKAKRETDDRAEAQRQAQLKATRDAVESRKNEQEATARALDEKLKILAQADGDLCKQKLEGLSVPGFTLKCDTLIPFGKLLGPVPVSQTASSLGDCAARCRKAETPRCVAFSFDAGAHVGAASCYLSGSIPAYNAAPNWIAGTR